MFNAVYEYLMVNQHKQYKYSSFVLLYGLQNVYKHHTLHEGIDIVYRN